MEIVLRFYALSWSFSLRFAARRGSLFQYVFFFLILFGASGCRSETPLLTGQGTPTGQSAPRYVGFSVMGPDWQVAEVFANEAERLTYLEKQGYLMAQHTSRLHGNMVRVPIYMWNVIGSGLPSATASTRKPLYQIDTDTISTTIEKISTFLRASLAGMEKDQAATGQPLRWQQWDALLAGIQKYNVELAADPASIYPAVLVTIVLTSFPPAEIIESPNGEEVRGLYQEMHIRFVRKLVQRYGQGYARDGTPAMFPVVAAIEMINEPDYMWLPDELKIEKALNPDAYPCDKYITQLHLSQVPENDLPGKGCIRKDGFYQEQPLPLPTVETPLKDFRWGSKFDIYVKFFAELHEHVSFAAKDESYRGGAEMVIVSSAVTHVNIDWFVRMFRANPETFRYVDKIAIHPYHWPRHDIHDMTFVDAQARGNWLTLNPRAFAREYFKRFDFIRELAALVAEPDWEKSYGLSGKALWVTEFGIPTKKLGKANASIPKHWKIFIYDRASGIPDGVGAIVWEDKWDAFFEQVPATFLHTNQVEAFLIYTLRESVGNETNDENHSNFSLYTSDWSGRLDASTFQQLSDFFQGFLG